MNRLPAFVYDPEAVSSRLLVRRFQEAGIKGWPMGGEYNRSHFVHISCTILTDLVP